MPRPLALLVEAQEPGALNLCRAFREAGHEVALLNRGPRPAERDAEVLELGRPSAVVDLYPQGRWRRQRAFYWLNGAGNHAARLGLGALAGPALRPAFDALLARPARARVVQAVGASGAEVVYSFWGIGQLPEQRALQRAGTGVPLVHQFQTYPQTEARVQGRAWASPLERSVLGALDGRVHASARMRSYVQRALRPTKGLDAVLPDAWGSWAHARGRLPRPAERDGVPRVVHVGVVPVTPGTYDDVAPQLRAIAAQGIEVHAVEGFRVEGVRTFPRMGLRALLTGELARFMTQFDALALLYNAPPGLQWFAGNMPARFLSGVSAGIPVAVPEGIFGAVEDFVRGHGNGFLFSDARDLAAKLRDEPLMERCRKAALALEREHRLERFLPQYQGFLEQVLDARGAGPSATLK